VARKPSPAPPARAQPREGLWETAMTYRLRQPPIEVYTDGGLVGKNPAQAGTWAWCHVDGEGLAVRSDCGLVLPELVRSLCVDQVNGEHAVKVDQVTSNFTEMLALVLGLEGLPQVKGWVGVVYSDNRAAVLRAQSVYETQRGRRESTSTFAGIPSGLRRRLFAVLQDMQAVAFVHLAGHPTKAHLSAGFKPSRHHTESGEPGRPVSGHNQTVDQLCTLVADRYTKGLLVP
jgi:ribonuclease HI